MKKTIEEIINDGLVRPEKEAVSDFLFNIASGKKSGWSTGFTSLDNYTGRIDRGQVWVIGGYTGTGKSYFILNMIHRMLRFPKEERPKIAVFSTELSKVDYVLRYVFMQTGVFPLKFMHSPDSYYQTAREKANQFFDDVNSNEFNIKIYGNISSVEMVTENLVGLRDSGNLPDIVFIDYIQELSAHSKVGEEDAMPIVAAALKTLAQKLNIAVVAVSQVNNKAMDKTFKQNESSLSPFSNGKKLSHMMHTGIVLSRKRKHSIRSYHLQADIVKARSGIESGVSFEIDGGYLLHEINYDRARELDMILDNFQTPEEAEKAVLLNNIIGAGNDSRGSARKVTPGLTREGQESFNELYGAMRYDSSEE